MNYSQKPEVYKFSDIFDYYPQTDILMPKFDVVIANIINRKNIPIRKEDHSGFMLNEVGCDISATWDERSEMLYIGGLYAI